MRHYDVVIVGGGVVGSASAYYLRKLGFSGSIAMEITDWANWIEPEVVLMDGTVIDLTKLKWTSADTEMVANLTSAETINAKHAFE
jgi:thioredoxin reductase